MKRKFLLRNRIKKKQERNEKLSIVRQGVGVPIAIPALRSEAGGLNLRVAQAT